MGDGSNRSAAILGSFLILSVNAYGFAFFLTQNTLNLQISYSIFLPTWLTLTAVLFVVLTAILRRKRRSLQDITIVFNIFSLVIIIAALLPAILAGSALQNARQPEILEEPSVHEWLQSTDINTKNMDLPDVYYIVLDAYARGDILQSRYDYDNSDMLEWLERRGFFLALQSHQYTLHMIHL